MNKKKYVQPALKVREVKVNSTLMAGSYEPSQTEQYGEKSAEETKNWWFN